MRQFICDVFSGLNRRLCSIVIEDLESAYERHQGHCLRLILDVYRLQRLELYAKNEVARWEPLAARTGLPIDIRNHFDDRLSAAQSKLRRVQQSLAGAEALLEAVKIKMDTSRRAVQKMYERAGLRYALR